MQKKIFQAKKNKKSKILPTLPPGNGQKKFDPKNFFKKNFYYFLKNYATKIIFFYHVVPEISRFQKSSDLIGREPFSQKTPENRFSRTN